MTAPFHYTSITWGLSVLIGKPILPSAWFIGTEGMGSVLAAFVPSFSMN